MKTKPFLLATAGSTVDGRAIDETMLREMAEGFNPATYGARVNIEHIRGFSGEKPFCAYGDVVELSVGEVDVDFHGETEKRLGLYGVLDLTDDAKKLIDAGQKVYPSVEIDPNFAGKGKAYLMGCAMTDMPASIATEKMQFNRSQPGMMNVGTDAPELAFAFELAESGNSGAAAADGFLAKFSAILDKFSGEPAAPAKEPEVPAKKDGDFDFAALKPMFEELGTAFAAQTTALQATVTELSDQTSVRFAAIEAKFDNTPVTQYTPRPAANGKHGDQTKTDC